VRHYGSEGWQSTRRCPWLHQCATTGSLDFATDEKVMELMFQLDREQGTTLVLVARGRLV